MPPFLSLHAFAAMRGEGLRAELRALFERLATAPGSDVTVRNDGMVQSGPDPVSAKEPLPQTPRRKPIANSANALRVQATTHQNQSAKIKHDT
jgi:hypothetical protein